MFKFLVTSLSVDDSMEVACRCFEGMKELLSHFGKVLLTEDQMEEFCDTIRLVLDGDALCQMDPDDDGIDDEENEEDEENDFEHDSRLYGYVSDCITELLKVYGENLGGQFDDKFKNSIAKRCKPTSSMDEKMYSAGILCDFYKYAPFFMSK